MPYNPHGIIHAEKIDDIVVGEYDVLYYSEIKERNGKNIKLKLLILM